MKLLWVFFLPKLIQLGHVYQILNQRTVLVKCFSFVLVAEWADHTYYRDSSSAVFPGVIPRSRETSAIGWPDRNRKISYNKQLHSAHAPWKVSILGVVLIVYEERRCKNSRRPAPKVIGTFCLGIKNGHLWKLRFVRLAPPKSCP